VAILVAVGGSGAANAAEEAEQEAAEDKYCAQQLVLGQAAEAAHGLTAALGMDDAQLGARLQRGEQAIVEEFAQHGGAEDQANLQYILHGTALKPEDLPAHIQKQIREHQYHGGVLEENDFDHGHRGMKIEDFVNHEHSRLAQLLRPHVLALRMYTSSSYPCFNRPLRSRQKPHPFAMSVYYLAEALKKLRAVAARLDPQAFTQEMILWRGMQDLTLDRDEFMSNGAAELAPMSTSQSKSVAFKYAASRTPLVFKYKTVSMLRGASIEFLSMYPKEREFLYPPLTFLQPESMSEEGGYHVVEVTPMMA